MQSKTMALVKAIIQYMVAILCHVITAYQPRNLSLVSLKVRHIVVRLPSP